MKDKDKDKVKSTTTQTISHQTLETKHIQYPVVQLRHDLSAGDPMNDSNVKIYAPDWVKQALTEITHHLDEKTFTIVDKKEKKAGQFTVKEMLSLKQLVMIARNESVNVTGVIKFELYGDDLGKKPEVIYALKDLVRQCVIVGRDNAVSYGGYPYGNKTVKYSSPIPVYICDLAALQFQADYNSGRLVLIAPENNPLPKGELDDFIFKQVVGEQKRNFADCEKDKSGRYHQITFKGKAVFLDTIAYVRFVVSDFILAATALEEAAQDEEALNFKFLKYGCGFFAAGISFKDRELLEESLQQGICLALVHLCMNNKLKHIKRIELPYYGKDRANLEQIYKHFGLECAFTNVDALYNVSPEKHTLAITNCADPHAQTGNEMHYGSVDAAIAENSESKGKKYFPALNNEIGEVYAKDILLNWDLITQQVSAIVDAQISTIKNTFNKEMKKIEENRDLKSAINTGSLVNLVLEAIKLALVYPHNLSLQSSCKEMLKAGEQHLGIRQLIGMWAYFLSGKCDTAFVNFKHPNNHNSECLKISFRENNEAKAFAKIAQKVCNGVLFDAKPVINKFGTFNKTVCISGRNEVDALLKGLFDFEKDTIEQLRAICAKEAKTSENTLPKRVGLFFSSLLPKALSSIEDNDSPNFGPK